MYVKVFSQIFDSSIADDPALRHFFQDILILSDPDGIVDMTPEAIAARTRLPLESVKLWLNQLQQPDKRSRSAEHDGKRIVLIDPHRDWGWMIVNFKTYDSMRNHFDRKLYMRNYMRDLRKNTCKTPVKRQSNNVKPCKHPLTMLAHPSPDPSPDPLKTEGASPRRPKGWHDIEEVRLLMAKSGLPESEAQKFFDYFESVGWKVGKARNPMVSLSGAVGGWASRWREKTFENAQHQSKPDNKPKYNYI